MNGSEVLVFNEGSSIDKVTKDLKFSSIAVTFLVCWAAVLYARIEFESGYILDLTFLNLNSVSDSFKKLLNPIQIYIAL